MWLWTQSPRGWKDCERRQGSRGYTQGSGNRGGISLWWIAVVVVLLFAISMTCCDAFSYIPPRRINLYYSVLICNQLAMVPADDTYFEEDFKQGDDEVDSVLEDLNWRVVKLRLEEENTKRFLKSKPRYLPYSECRKWVSAWSRWSSESEW